LRTKEVVIFAAFQRGWKCFCVVD